MKRLLLLAALSSIVLSACTDKRSTIPKEESSSSAAKEQSSERERVIRETKNVSYSGIVRPLGISIYMEGSHRLSLPDGRFILLESNSVDLNGYVGEEVNVVGAIRPTVESDAMIMRVESISLVQSEEEGGGEKEKEEKPEEGTTATSSLSSAVGDQRESVNSNRGKKDSSAARESEVSTEDVLQAPELHSQEFLKRLKDMADEEFTAENWTQEYCSSHIGFCVPVHRNWWYKSFGATSTHYWHLEMNSAPIEELNEGPLVVNLNGESIGALGIEEGAIRVEGDEVVGYRSWTNGRHFEIRAHSSLRGAVEYITENLRSEG